jgi:hypothetical protein
MVISVHAAHDVIGNNAETNKSIEQSKMLYSESGTDVRIVSVGLPKEQARQAVLERVRPTAVDSSPPWLFVDAVDNAEQLRTQIQKYVGLMANMLERDVRWQRHRAAGKRESGERRTIMSKEDFS